MQKNTDKKQQANPSSPDGAPNDSKQSSWFENKIEKYKEYFHPDELANLQPMRRTAIFILPSIIHFLQSAFCGFILAWIALGTQKLRDTKFLTLALDFGDSFLHHYSTFPLALFYLTLIASLLALVTNDEVSFLLRKVLAEPLESFIFHTSSLSFGALIVGYWSNHFPSFGMPPWVIFSFIFFASILLSAIVRAIPGVMLERRKASGKLMSRVAAAGLTLISIVVLVLTTVLLSKMGS
ncbi:hypothetical protein [Pseudoduganella buxea]|uniref:Uncharacterized protein n=1 Tax=Pseudoduganella buxea TaxID=1949069 RepID=A0A6I3T100_9BURK|nr:hypothetical protein [Pseudoduganella buxea]MTV55218.1 hypothetical protein [Pseudoduganella buxea]